MTRRLTFFSLPVFAMGTMIALAFPAQGAPSFEKDVLPLLEKYCYDCHGDGASKGEFSLDAEPDLKKLTSNHRFWTAIDQQVSMHVMPPSDKKQPTQEERQLISHWIDQVVFYCDCSKPDPGRVTIRRAETRHFNAP
jgi:uncharacterized membrane protein